MITVSCPFLPERVGVLVPDTFLLRIFIELSSVLLTNTCYSTFIDRGIPYGTTHG